VDKIFLLFYLCSISRGEAIFQYLPPNFFLEILAKFQDLQSGKSKEYLVFNFFLEETQNPLEAIFLIQFESIFILE
jgi:hypothetical protein